MRRQYLFFYAFFAVLYSVAALPSNATDGVNYNADGTPCYNTVNGNHTTATDIDGNLILGCNNVVFNNTNGVVAEPVYITGSDNVVEDNIVDKESSDGNGWVTVGYNGFDNSGDVILADISNGNTIVGNVADYIDLWSSNNNTIIGNIAINDEIYLHDDANNNNIENNVVDHVIEVSDATSNTVEWNSAVRAQRYEYLVAACSR